MDEQMIRSIVEDVIGKIQKQDPLDSGKIPIAVSARHVHLTEPHIAVLFGENYQLTPKNPFLQSLHFNGQRYGLLQEKHYLCAKIHRSPN